MYSFTDIPVWAYFVLLLVAFLIYGLSPETRWRLRHIQTVPGAVPCLGHIPAVIKAGSFGEAVEALRPKSCSIFKLYMGRVPIVCLLNPDDCQKMFNKFQTFPGRGLEDLLPRPLPKDVLSFDETYLFESTGDLWRTLRPVWSNYLSHSKSLDLFRDVIDGAIDRAERYLEDGKGKPTDIFPMFRDLTMESIGSAAFGVSLERDPKTGVNPLAESSFKIVAGLSPKEPTVTLAVLAPFAWELIRFVSEYISPRYLAARRHMRDYCHQLVKSAREVERSADHGAETLAKSRTGSFLHHLAQLSVKAKRRPSDPGSKPDEGKEKWAASGAGEDHSAASAKLDDTVLAAQTVLMLVAGFETTSSTLNFVLWHLVHHPKVQRRLLDEIDAEAARGNVGHSADYSKYVYLDAVINETLRLYPPGGFIARKASEDTELGGKFIPSGTVVAAMVWPIHRDPALWGPDAAEWRPERWLEPAIKDRHPYQFMPFGAGPRVCPGKGFALMESKMAIVRLLSKFSFETDPHGATKPVQHMEAFVVGPVAPVMVVPVARAG